MTFQVHQDVSSPTQQIFSYAYSAATDTTESAVVTLTLKDPLTSSTDLDQSDSLTQMTLEDCGPDADCADVTSTIVFRTGMYTNAINDDSADACLVNYLDKDSLDNAAGCEFP